MSVLNRRLGVLDIQVPRYKKTDKPNDDIHAIAVESTGLKRSGRGEWRREWDDAQRRFNDLIVQRRFGVLI